MYLHRLMEFLDGRGAAKAALLSVLNRYLFWYCELCFLIQYCTIKRKDRRRREYEKRTKATVIFTSVVLEYGNRRLWKKETDKTDAADMAKTVPNYTLIYQSEQSSEAESANKNAEKTQEKI